MVIVQPEDDEEMLTALFAPDVSLPAQFYAGRKKQTPVQRLFTAILHDAIAEYRMTTWHVGAGGKAADRAWQLREVARVWFESDDPGPWPHSFPFVMVCTALGLDPAAVRRAVLR